MSLISRNDVMHMPGAKSTLEQKLGKHYMAYRTAASYLLFVVALGIFVSALLIAYLYLDEIPKRASLMVVISGVVSAIGAWNAFVVVRHTSGRRWPAMIVGVLTTGMTLGVVLMYIAGFVL